MRDTSKPASGESGAAEGSAAVHVSAPARSRASAQDPGHVLKALLHRSSTDPQLRAALQAAYAEVAAPAPADHAAPAAMLGACLAMRRVFNDIARMARSADSVLITGETGTGKELAARAIHDKSGFAKGPFVAINCAGLPSTLIGSELFGYERGAFTGANARRIGRIESAAGGTVFLDEIGDLPMEVQGHLLRFLQEGAIDRLGGTRPVPVCVRVVAATNVDLRAAIAAGRFRRDLYYRIAVLSLELPPLRARGQDIELLADRALLQFAQERGGCAPSLTPQARARLHAHDWPGNVRELNAAMRRAALRSEGPWIDAHEIEFGVIVRALDQAATAAVPGGQASRRRAPSRPELRAALKRLNGNISALARELGVSRPTAYAWLRNAGVELSGPSEPPAAGQPRIRSTR